MPRLLLNIIGDTSKRIRGLITAQGMERYSSYDFMEVACRSKDKTGASSRNAFKRLIAEESKFKNEILELTEYIRFPGAKQETPTMTLRGLQRLLMILGGRVATDYRKLMESTFTRVMGGDTSLVEIIEANAASTEPVQQAFKRALAQEPVEPVLDDMCKRHKKDLAELDILERKKAIQAKEMSNFKTWKELMDSVEPNWLKDQRLKLQTEDHLKNLLFNSVELPQHPGPPKHPGPPRRPRPAPAPEHLHRAGDQGPGVLLQPDGPHPHRQDDSQGLPRRPQQGPAQAPPVGGRVRAQRQQLHRAGPRAHGECRAALLQ